MNVFKSEDYAIAYEQVAADMGAYDLIARKTAELMDITPGAVVLDVGCGTGISIDALLAKRSGVAGPISKLVGIDESASFLNLARVKFGLAEKEGLLEFLKEHHPYPSFLHELYPSEDLGMSVENAIARLSPNKDLVTFLQREVVDLAEYKGVFHHAMASQVIHWFRNRGVPAVERGVRFNLEYERRALTSIHDALQDQGTFGFNTSGGDYCFPDEKMNDVHLSKRAIALTFHNRLLERLGLPSWQTRPTTFMPGDIEKLVSETGFEVLTRKEQLIGYAPKKILLYCAIGAPMRIFLQNGIDMSEQERNAMIEEALLYALAKSPPDPEPVIETAVHYVVRKL